MDNAKANSSWHTANGGALPFRPPTLDQALQYTPVSSIVPFSPDIIPFPSAGPPTSSDIFTTEDERRSARRELDSLNSEANNSQSTSVRLQKTLQDLQQLLNADDLTEFKFKPIMQLATPPPESSATSTNGSHSAAVSPLGAFTSMVLANTDISYLHTSKSAPPNRAQSQKSGQTAPPQVPRSTPKHPRVVVNNNAASKQNSELGLLSSGKSPSAPPTPKKSPAMTGTPRVAVVIPGPPSSQREEHRSYTHLEEMELLSKKRKRDESEADKVALALTSDQKQKADAAVQALNALLQQIFDAEDEDHQGTCFTSLNTLESEYKVLHVEIQARLEKALQRVISAGRFSSLPVEQVSRIQKLCEPSASAVEQLSLTIGGDWADSDVEEWLPRVSAAENGLRACKILLRTMTAGRDEKQLFSEDTVQSVISGSKHVLDTCFIPVVEARANSDSDVFKTASAQMKPLSALLQLCGSVLRLLGNLMVKVDVADRAISSVDDLSSTLVFVENAHSEKDSALGIQRFESVRRIAMDVLAKLFARYEEHRTSISDEILMSLEKLPVQRQSARQYKMVDGKPIQLVSALIMRLVQTSALRTIRESKIPQGASASADGEDEEDSSSDLDSRSPSKNARHANGSCDPSKQGLDQMAKQLYEGAESTAKHLVHFMVQRALKSTKSGDQPYRNLLDIFIEDFLSVLGSPEWPAAQLLLEVMLRMMVGLASNDNQPVPARNMALDVMGTMALGLVDFRLHFQQTLRSLDVTQSELSNHLVPLAEDALKGDINPKDLFHFDGPYRVILEFLQLMAKDDDVHMQSAIGCQLTNWAHDVCAEQEREGDSWPAAKALGRYLKNMMLDQSWLAAEYDFERVSTAQGRLAAGIVTLQGTFCRYFKNMLGLLVHNLFSQHVTLKSRSLKSIARLLEKDPSIIKENEQVIVRIIQLMSQDSSPMVRKDALALLSETLSHDLTLEAKYLDRFVQRVNDPAVTVKKLAMKTVKDVYLRNEDEGARLKIVNALLARVKDHDQGIADLARQTFEEVWIAPFHEGSKTDKVKGQLTLRNQVALIIRTVDHVEHSSFLLEALDSLLQGILSNESKNTVQNFKVCKAIVADMFEGVIDTDLLPGKPSQAHTLQALSIFARANPKLFTIEQVKLLQPYTKNLSTSEELPLYRSVIVVYRYVFPSFSTLEEGFLKETHTALMQSIQKVGKETLYDVAMCLWIIQGVLKDTAGLVRVVCSVVNNLNKEKDKLATDEQMNRRKGKWLAILGAFGKVCDFEDHVAAIKKFVPVWKGASAATLFVETTIPFTRQQQGKVVRAQAFETLGMVCQSFPASFMRADVGAAFDLVFINEDAQLEQVVLAQFMDFFAAEERRSESGAVIAVGEGAVRSAERLGSSLQASDNDGAALSLARRYLVRIVKIALGKSERLALLAARTIVSISRQGLVHPKECGPAFVALETSSIPQIATIAFEEHRSLHNKHETMFEKEYMAAVAQAFDYQRDIVEDTRGVVNPSFSPKLHLLFEVLKTGNSKVRKKFLANLCDRINFELPKLDSTGQLPHAFLYARFCLENLAFFDYARVDEILHLIASLEKAVTRTGAVVAHAIESDIYQIRLESEQKLRPDQQAADAIAVNHSNARSGTVEAPITNGEGHAAPIIDALASGIDRTRLRHLTLATMILTMVWDTRTFLRQLWGLQKQAKQGNKMTIKDMNKAPFKINFVKGDKLWERFTDITKALESPEAMLAQCQAFTDLMSVDNELKVGSDEEDDEAAVLNAAAGYETPDEGEADGDGPVPASGGGKGRKRKASAGLGNTPKKQKKAGTGKRGRPAGTKIKNRRSTSKTPDDEDGDWD